jgi:hypothetical protein
MASKHQLTGMTGVYLVAAELSRRGFIASPTSRSAYGADLLVTDAFCQRSYAVQVKTNASSFRHWLLNKNAHAVKSRSLIYALVNLRKDRTEYFLVPSLVVAKNVTISRPSKTRKNYWYTVHLERIAEYRDRWHVFKQPSPPTIRSTTTRPKRRAG